MKFKPASGILIGALLFLVRAQPVVTGEVDRQNFVGDQACRACHAEKVDSYFHTAHHIASRLPTRESILGSFEKPKNVFKTSNPGLFFRMESRADGFYQSAINESPPPASGHSERIENSAQPVFNCDITRGWPAERWIGRRYCIRTAVAQFRR